MGIIKAKKRKKDPNISKNAMMIMTKRELNYAVRKTNAKDIGEIDGSLYRFYLGPSDVAICGPFLGAPQAVIGLERLVALGAGNIWVFSLCGSLNEDIKIGDIVLPTKVFSEEGTSRHYPIDVEPVPDTEMQKKIEEKLYKKGINFFKGPFWTTDAPYRETKEKIEEYKKKGAISVDMEISALISASIFRNASIGAIFVVSDELYSKKWVPGFSSSRLKESSERSIDILLELALRPEAV